MEAHCVVDVKATALLKLVYLEMFGHDMSWAAFHVLEVMSSAKYLQKRVGYLGAVQSFRPDTEVLMLATNLLKKVRRRRAKLVIGWTPWLTRETGPSLRLPYNDVPSHSNITAHHYLFPCLVCSARPSTPFNAFEPSNPEEDYRNLIPTSVVLP
jgi:hypothetical protein